MKIIGVLVCIASIILYFIIVYFLYPRLFLKYKYSRILREGNKSNDFAFYLPDKHSLDAIIKYELIKNVKNGKKYALVTLKDNIDVISLAVYSFDYKQRPIDFMVVDYLEPRNVVIIEVKSKTFGLNIQVVSYNNTKLMDIEQEKKLRLFRSNLLVYSVFVGLTTTIFAFLFTLGISISTISSYDILSMFYMYTEVLSLGISIFLLILTFVLSAIASYFIVLFVNRRQFIEE